MAFWIRNNNVWKHRVMFRRDANSTVYDSSGKPTTIGASSNTKKIIEVFNRYHRLYYTDADGNTQKTGWLPVYKYALVQISPASDYMVTADIVNGSTKLVASGNVNVWTACSVTCGGGTKTRKFECRRLESRNADNSWNYTVKDMSFCEKAGININSAPSGKPDTRTTVACNTDKCTFWMHGCVADDRAQMWAKYNPNHGWTEVLPYGSYMGNQKKGYNYSYELRWNTHVFAHDKVYIKYFFKDSNGTHTGTRLQICTQWNSQTNHSTSGKNCSPWMVYTGYLGAGSNDNRTYYWFIWDRKANRIYRKACSGVSNNTYNSKDWSGGGGGSACWGGEKCNDTVGTDHNGNWTTWGHKHCGIGENIWDLPS